MLEMNKEYTYKQICEILGWKQGTGNTKIAQIKEIERCYEFYHPINKKTHKKKKSYIFTEQYDTPVEPSRKNNGGARNTKNIDLMMKYIQGKMNDGYLCEYHTMTKWYCDILELFDKETCNKIYNNDEEIKTYCEKYHITNSKLFCDYVSNAKSILKDMFIRALSTMRKTGLCEYYDGYKFIYSMHIRGKGNSSVCTDVFNELIINNETKICNDMKEEYNLSDKLKGRQLLMQIYSRKDLTDEFNKRKLNVLMNDKNIIKYFNQIAIDTYGCGCAIIDDKHYLNGYYRAICINELNFNEYNTVSLANDIINTIKKKTRKILYSNKITNYNNVNDIYDIEVIENLLFDNKLEN